MQILLFYYKHIDMSGSGVRDASTVRSKHGEYLLRNLRRNEEWN
jgi:hypothetical protein